VYDLDDSAVTLPFDFIIMPILSNLHIMYESLACADLVALSLTPKVPGSN